MSATTGYPALEFSKSEVSDEQRRELEIQAAELIHALTVRGGYLRPDDADRLACKLDKRRQILRSGFWPVRPGEPT